MKRRAGVGPPYEKNERRKNMIILTQKEYSRRIKEEVNKAMATRDREHSLFMELERIRKSVYEMETRFEELKARYETRQSCACGEIPTRPE